MVVRTGRRNPTRPRKREERERTADGTASDDAALGLDRVEDRVERLTADVLKHHRGRMLLEDLLRRSGLVCKAREVGESGGERSAKSRGQCALTRVAP